MANHEPEPSVGKLRVALGVGAAIWLFLLAAGLVEPVGWAGGLTRPIGRTENYVIWLWVVTLILAPLLACRHPLRYRGAVDVYLLGVLSVIVSTFLAGAPEIPGDAAPIAAALLSAGLMLWARL
jgi:hypothetical protein